MPSIGVLIDAISTHLNAALVGRGLAPLVDGGIVLGRVRVDENSSPNRVVMVPRGSRFEPREQPSRSNVDPARSPGHGVRSCAVSVRGGGYVAPTVTFSPPELPGGVPAAAVAIVVGGSVVALAMTSSGSGYVSPPTVTVAEAGGAGATATARLAPTAEQLAQFAQRSIWTDVVIFECHTWGIDFPGGPDADFDATQLLYQQVIASAHAVAPGAVKPTSGAWAEAKPGAAQLDITGHYYVFLLEVRTPVLAEPLAYAPIGVQGAGTNQMAIGSDTAQPA